LIFKSGSKHFSIQIFFLLLVKEIPIAFNNSAATTKEFEAEYDFKRPLKKEKDRKKTIVLVSDTLIHNSEDQKDSEDA
jgi:hypothetical protein